MTRRLTDKGECAGCGEFGSERRLVVGVIGMDEAKDDAQVDGVGVAETRRMVGLDGQLSWVWRCRCCVLPKEESLLVAVEVPTCRLENVGDQNGSHLPRRTVGRRARTSAQPRSLAGAGVLPSTPAARHR